MYLFSPHFVWQKKKRYDSACEFWRGPQEPLDGLYRWILYCVGSSTSIVQYLTYPLLAAITSVLLAQVPTAMPTVHLLDYVAGNIRSLVNAINQVGYDVEWVKSPEDVKNADVSQRPRTNSTMIGSQSCHC